MDSLSVDIRLPSVREMQSNCYNVPKCSTESLSLSLTAGLNRSHSSIRENKNIQFLTPSVSDIDYSDFLEQNSFPPTLKVLPIAVGLFSPREHKRTEREFSAHVLPLSLK